MADDDEDSQEICNYKFAVVQSFGGRAILRFGELVLVDPWDDGGPFVAQLVRPTASRNRVKAKRYLPLAHFEQLRSLMPNNHFCRDLVEIVQENTLVNLDPSHIVELAFVFKPEDLENDSLYLHGMKHVYVCCQKSDGLLADFVSFPPTTDEMPRGITQVVHDDIERIRTALTSLLNKRTEQQGFRRCKGYRKVACSDQTWSYLKRNLNDLQQSAGQHTGSLIEYRTTAEKKQKKVKVVRPMHILRVVTSEHVAQAVNVLGSFWMFGSRNLKLRLGNNQGERPIHDTDNMNYLLTEGQEVDDIDTFRLTPDTNGVDFCWDGRGIVNIKVRYELVKRTKGTGRSVLNPGTAAVASKSA